MNSTKISLMLQRTLMQELALQSGLMTIIQTLYKNGGRVLLVGGAVRDLFLHQTCKDLDIEIHGLSLAAVEGILAQFGTVFMVGKSFGVFRVAGFTVDWSLPRSDSAGRKPAVIVDPSMSLRDAFARRDLTINAMGIDLITYELIDPFGGFNDLANKILRCTDPNRFVEDPLRFYRVMQSIGRFAMYPDSLLNDICANMDITSVSIERIAEEFQKLLLRSSRPSHGIRWLATIGRLATVLPELAATRGIEQDARWHPEGDVFEHLMQTLDASVDYEYHDASTTLAFRYAALCHDLGKVSTTQRHADGTITSYGHDVAGVKPTKNLLRRITRNEMLLEVVQILVRYHMAPGQFVNDGAKVPAYKRLARTLYPHATLAMLADLACADKRGRNPSGQEPLTQACDDLQLFRKTAEQAQVIVAPEDPVLQGRDLLDTITPGPEMGRLLKRAYHIQIEEGITDKQELLKRIFE